MNHARVIPTGYFPHVQNYVTACASLLINEILMAGFFRGPPLAETRFSIQMIIRSRCLTIRRGKLHKGYQVVWPTCL